METMIYLDMDGVLVDLYSMFVDQHQVEHWGQVPGLDTEFSKFKKTDFFQRAPEFVPLTTELVIYVHKLTQGRWGILSTPIFGDQANSAKWKSAWLADRDIQPHSTIYSMSKHHFAMRPNGKRNILVDDSRNNIEEWVDAGGVGFRFQSDKSDFQLLRDQLKRCYNTKSLSRPEVHWL